MEHCNMRQEQLNNSWNGTRGTGCVMPRFLKLLAPERLSITGSNGEKYVGGSQDWYEDRWYRMSGCGPVAASNMIWYKSGTKSGMDNYLELMNEMFTFVTPGRYGVNTSAIFTEGILRYGAKNALQFVPQVLEIPFAQCKRPNIEFVLAFLASALLNDSPIAFLNLSNGVLDNLDNWHWVTIMALDTETMLVEICDYGEKLEIDMSAWLRTSLLGGAFVFLVF